jgi:hypothetical protein
MCALLLLQFLRLPLKTSKYAALAGILLIAAALEEELKDVENP